MKTFSAEAMAAIEAGDAVVSGAVLIEADDAVRVWGGWGTIEIDGQLFEGLGSRGLAQVSGRSIGGSEQNVTLTLSGIDPVVLDALDDAGVRDAWVTLWRLIFASDAKRLLDVHVFDRGRLDDLITDETIGGEAMLSALIEGAARGLGRRGGRMRTDADQRLVKPTDGFFRNVSFAGEKMLYWGGQKPTTAGSAFPGSGGPGMGLGGGGGRYDQERLAQY